jgi:hypothetical protein
MLDKDSIHFCDDIFYLQYARYTERFCYIAVNLEEKLKNYLQDTSEIDSQLDSFISHAQIKFSDQPTISNDKKQNVSNFQFNKQQISPKYFTQPSKQDFPNSTSLSPKQEYLKPVQASNFQSNFQNLHFEKSPLNDQEFKNPSFQENENLNLQHQSHSNQTINEQIFSELDDLNISYSSESKNLILLKIVQLFKKIISSNFQEHLKAQNIINFSKFEEMIDQQIKGRDETINLNTFYFNILEMKH